MQFDKNGLPITASQEEKECSTEALNFDVGKMRFHLIDIPFLEEFLRVLEAGAQKYTPDNWMKGTEFTRSYNSMMRHALAWGKGEDIDPESGFHHLAHVVCRCMFLIYYQREGVGVDDRRKSGGRDEGM